MGLSHGHRLLGQEVWLHVGWGQKRHVRAQGLAGQLSLVLGGAATHSVHFCHIVLDCVGKSKNPNNIGIAKKHFKEVFKFWHVHVMKFLSWTFFISNLCAESTE